jgi:hypothetical protein
MSEGSYAGRVVREGNPVNATVAAVRLRRWLEEPVDLLKLNIEGAEPEVLGDCGDLLRNVRRAIVEYHSFAQEPQELSDLLSILREGGSNAQCLFEYYGGHPDIGLMDEALGPGMPSSVGEDTYLFYKVLKAGHAVVYEPAAHVWHKHRREESELRRQLYGYSKGHVAYHLTTLFSDHDLRGLIQVTLWLPLFHLRRIRACLRRWSDYPLSLLMLEIAGNLVGPLALWQSRRRVQREGRSGPYVPVARRRTSRVETTFFGTRR